MHCKQDENIFYKSFIALRCFIHLIKGSPLLYYDLLNIFWLKSIFQEEKPRKAEIEAKKSNKGNKIYKRIDFSFNLIYLLDQIID